jgi:hypothetical protein
VLSSNPPPARYRPASHDEPANFFALNLMHGIVAGAKDVD